MALKSATSIKSLTSKALIWTPVGVFFFFKQFMCKSLQLYTNQSKTFSPKFFSYILRQIGHLMDPQLFQNVFTRQEEKKKHCKKVDMVYLQVNSCPKGLLQAGIIYAYFPCCFLTSFFSHPSFFFFFYINSLKDVSICIQIVGTRRTLYAMTQK